MNCRWRWQLLVGLAGALPLAGCLSTFWTTPANTSVTPGTPSSPSRAKQDLSPDKAAELCVACARSLEEGGHVAEAIGEYEKARQQNPHLEKLSARLAVLYDRVGEHKQAITEYQRALKARPKDADLLNNLGYCHYCQGNWSEAENYLRQAIAVDDKHQRAWVNLGLTLGQQEHYPESLAAFRKVVGAAEAQCNLAFILSTQGKFDEARKSYREALTLEPGLQLAQAALDRLEHPRKKAPDKSPAATRAKPDRAMERDGADQAPGKGGWATLEDSPAEPARPQGCRDRTSSQDRPEGSAPRPLPEAVRGSTRASDCQGDVESR
jgi:Tfp pilus assembly protein PilF